MPMVKKSITLTDRQDERIQAEVAAGNYGTDSEYIREAIREKQSRTDEIDYIRAKLIRAEQSGFVDKTPKEMLEGFKEKARQNRKL